MSIINAGKTFALVATPASKRTVKTLESAGARVVLFPPVETAACELDEQAQRIFADALSYDWLIFFDVLTVDYFLQKLEKSGADQFELDRRRICACGEAVADRLRFAELHADVVPRLIQAPTVVAAMSDYIGAEQLSENRFLLIKQKSASGELKNNLTACGAAAADELEIYETTLAEQTDAARLKALLYGGAIDEFIFTAPEDLIALRAFLKTGDIAGFLCETKVCAADPVTFQLLREHELAPQYFTAR